MAIHDHADAAGCGAELAEGDFIAVWAGDAQRAVEAAPLVGVQRIAATVDLLRHRTIGLLQVHQRQGAQDVHGTIQPSRFRAQVDLEAHVGGGL